MRHRLLAGLLLSWLLGGCALRAPIEVPVAEPAAREARLAALARWELRGRVALRGPQGAGQGNLRWRQEGSATHLAVSGPFGAGAWQLWSGDGRLRIETQDGETLVDARDAAAVADFLDTRLGWPLPLDASRYWLLGLADPSAKSRVTHDAEGRPARIRQHGWEIRYEEFVLYEALWLPRRLVAETAAGRVRLVVDRWHW